MPTLRPPSSRSTLSRSNSAEGTLDHQHSSGAGDAKVETDDAQAAQGLKQEEDSVKDEDADARGSSAEASRSASVEAKPESAIPKLEEGRPSATPPVSSRSKSKPEPQLIGHLRRAEEDALRTFVEIPANHYQYGTLGRSREALESMTCDCQYEHGVDDRDVACGHDSDCINRLTQVECMPDDCRCGGYCQNQRFQRKEYAPIDIVLTEKKGFGLRAAENLPKDTFIYEYLGDVVSQPSFLKRMRLYAEEGIRHFYFMMLQKDEFIDATKRGGIGRFANHSCNPNCYVAKWTVGQHVRMGIFANRHIKKDEELTFNYNVDRYGHDAQPCYCGESNCVGFIGGKTQTDIAAMDDLYLDALGISEEVANLGLKGNRKKKSKKLDEDYLPTLKPLVEKDVPKVVQALRQTQSRKVLVKLLMRVKLTEDQSPLRQLMRLRGFSVMTNILEDYSSDVEVSTLAIECMTTWPLIQRNKVEDSKINVPVQACAQSENQALAELAQKLLTQWEALEYAYRIPKRLKMPGEDNALETTTYDYRSEDPRPAKRVKSTAFEFEEPKFQLRPVWFQKRLPTSQSISADLKRETSPDPEAIAASLGPQPSRPTQQELVAAIIAKAQAEAEAAAVAPSAAGDAAKADDGARKRSSKHKKMSEEKKEALKEKKLLKLVGAVVVKCMSKYSKRMDHDHFKKHAKELTHIIAEKEKKSSSYKEGRLDSLSDEKIAKIKKFAKEYIAKLLHRLEKGKRHSSSAANPDDSMDASGSGATLAQDDTHEEMDLNAVMPELSTVDLMDLDEDMDEGEGDGEGEGEGEGDSFGSEQSPPDSVSALETPSASDAPTPVVTPVLDPRLRHRNEECGWDPDSDKLSVRQGLSTVSVGS